MNSITQVSAVLFQKGAQYAAMRVRWFESIAADMDVETRTDYWLNFCEFGIFQLKGDK